MAPLRQMVGQALQDHLRRKIVEEELKSSSALLRDAKEALEIEVQRRANEDAADAEIAAEASAAGQPEPDAAPKLAKDEANNRKAEQLLDAYESLKEDRLALFEELQTLQSKEGRVYGMDELKQQKETDSNLTDTRTQAILRKSGPQRFLDGVRRRTRRVQDRKRKSLFTDTRTPRRRRRDRRTNGRAIRTF